MELCDIEKKIFQMPDLDINKINQVYFGKLGCACGCGGNYHESEKMKKRAIAIMKKNAGHGLIIQGGIGEDKTILSWETETRAVRIYTKEDSGR
jgi:hypothetical protein